MTQEDHTQEDQRTGTDDTIVRWRCLNCGQIYFTHADEQPPDICDYCRDMTTWRRVPTLPDASSRPD